MNTCTCIIQYSLQSVCHAWYGQCAVYGMVSVSCMVWSVCHAWYGQCAVYGMVSVSCMVRYDLCTRIIHVHVWRYYGIFTLYFPYS